MRTVNFAKGHKSQEFEDVSHMTWKILLPDIMINLIPQEAYVWEI